MINTLQIGDLEFQDYNRMQLKHSWGYEHTNIELENYRLQECRECTKEADWNQLPSWKLGGVQRTIRKSPIHIH